MPDRFLDQYDEAHSMLMEAIWERYASGRSPEIIRRGLKAIEVLRSDAESEMSGPELVAA
jgi:hypothetical protein